MAPFDARLVNTAHGPMWVFAGDTFVSRSLELYGEYSAAETDIFQQIVRPGATVVEVGANLGSHTIMLARACSPGLLYAFEPQQRVFQLLCANVVQNQLTNVRLFPEAVGESEGWARIPILDYAAAGNFGGVAVTSLPGNEGERTADATRVITLDALNLGRCDVLKIDVEGWEVQVLRGGRDLIRRSRPVIYLENDRASHQGELIAMLDAAGYASYWHIAPLFRPDNFNRRTDDIFPGVAGLNMLCVPGDRPISVGGLEKIDPANWRSPLKPLP